MHPVGKRKSVIEQIAHRAMKEHGFLPDFSKAALHELESAHQAGLQAQFHR